MHFHDTVRRARARHQLTLRELAERVGISHAYCQAIECGQTVPTKERAEVLARTLDLDPSAFQAACSSARIAKWHNRLRERVQEEIGSLTLA